ncbi:primosomal protein N' [Heliobacterium gestii]|uniref:Replication restart protein PriA n=1 Tax=Heliomicrobium gestii TaxID=2699 RepID=A0A845LBN5_HELGE|nr:primosomal protein N' [Heliomicrobium gestii]MBM7867007.1 primosomal protein N' (replication factor Y) [Heliomicrobium gestii]MZP43578.1 primosomal protein N' [Heliomicrobium gestii]
MEPRQRPELAQVIVDIPHRDLDRVFHYRIPDALAEEVLPGREVWVAFHGKLIRGWVLGLEAATAETEKAFALQPVEAVNGSYRLGDDLIALVPWLARETLGTMADVLRLMAPPGPPVRPAAWVFLASRPDEETIAFWEGIDLECAGLLRRLARAPQRRMKYASLTGKAIAVPPAVIERLVAAGLVVVRRLLPKAVKAAIPSEATQKKDSATMREHAGKTAGESGMGSPSKSAAGGDPAFAEPILTPDQERAVHFLTKALAEMTVSGPGAAASDRRPFLLHGVTGSGKTEVYIRAIGEALAQGRQALLLVPEIALTPQTERRLRERFGDAVALLHSGLADAARRQEWQRIHRGDADLVVGARSAVFAPLPRLGLIIVDEEHEPSYQQENDLKYHAREAAVERARHCGAVVVFGSATPALETYAQALSGRFRLLQLRQRPAGGQLPPVDVIDMRSELADGNKGMLSRSLLAAVEERLQRRQQVILYLNRRGFSTFVICRECGTVVTCPRCSISLVYHRQGEQLHCHYCNYRQDVPQTCPHCRSRAIRYFGAGTQRIEEELRASFPGVPVLRMDRDVAEREGIAPVLDAFGRGEAPILVGTQMIAKGLDFPRVTLVGVLAADASLHISDFRAAERTFQLLSQVAGRAGRARDPGQVILQTYCPEHYCLQAVQFHDYEGFFRREIELRQQLSYPPFARLARVLFSGPEEPLVRLAADTWAEILRDLAVAQAQIRVDTEGFDVWGPAPAPVAKVENRFRWLLTLRVKGDRTEVLRSALSAAARDYDRRRGRPVGVTISLMLNP